MEIFSLHGCSESDAAPYPMLHDMGPRDSGSTAEAGWSLGHRFGIIASTDHHSACPGSHGDGRIGVFATALTREALWEAFRSRRVFAATGDRIDARLFVNDAWIGETVRASGRHHLRLAGARQRCTGPGRGTQERPSRAPVLSGKYPLPGMTNRYRLRVTWGWGRREEPVDWTARLTLSAGAVTSVETCFAGPPVVAPVSQADDAEIRRRGGFAA